MLQWNSKERPCVFASPCMTFHMIALCIALYLLTLRTAFVLRLWYHPNSLYSNLHMARMPRVSATPPHACSSFYCTASAHCFHLRITTLCPIVTWHVFLIVCCADELRSDFSPSYPKPYGVRPPDHAHAVHTVYCIQPYNSEITS